MTKAEQKAFEIVIEAAMLLTDILRTKELTPKDEQELAQAALLLRASAQTLQEN